MALLINGTNNVLLRNFVGMFSLASRLDNIVRSKASTGIIGVPFCYLESEGTHNSIKGQENKDEVKNLAVTTHRSSDISISTSASKALPRSFSDMNAQTDKRTTFTRSSSTGEVPHSPISDVLHSISERNELASPNLDGNAEMRSEREEAHDQEEVAGETHLNDILNLKLRALLSLSLHKNEKEKNKQNNR